MPSPRTRGALGATIALTALLAVGCVPEPGPTPSGSAPAPRPSTSTPAPAPTEEPSETPTPAPTAVSDPACLLGEWEMGQDALTAYYTQINDLQAGSGVTFSPSGSATLAMRGDGTFSWMPSVEITAEVAGTPILVTLGGSVDGSYSATDTSITTSDESTGNLQITATIDGTPTDPGPIGGQIGGAPVNGATYVCTDTSLQLTGSVDDAPVTSQLTRLSHG